MAERRRRVETGEPDPATVKRLLKTHQRIARALNIPELDISLEDARDLADAFASVEEYTGWVPSGPVVDIGATLLTLGAVYAPLWHRLLGLVWGGKRQATPGQDNPTKTTVSGRGEQPGAAGAGGDDPGRRPPPAPPAAAAAPPSSPAFSAIPPLPGAPIVAANGGAFTVSPAPSTMRERQDEP